MADRPSRSKKAPVVPPPTLEEQIEICRRELARPGLTRGARKRAQELLDRLVEEKRCGGTS